MAWMTVSSCTGSLIIQGMVELHPTSYGPASARDVPSRRLDKTSGLSKRMPLLASAPDDPAGIHGAAVRGKFAPLELGRLDRLVNPITLKDTSKAPAQS